MKNKVIKEFLALNPIKKNYEDGVYYVDHSESGFFHIEFINGEILQCCVQHGSRVEYLKQINSHDSGFDDGICGDVNDWCYEQIEGIISEFCELVSQPEFNASDIVLSVILKEARRRSFRIL
jgi:hypothetical protein